MEEVRHGANPEPSGRLARSLLSSNSKERRHHDILPTVASGMVSLFVMTRLADRSNVRVYAGSWTEWGSTVGYPIER